VTHLYKPAKVEWTCWEKKTVSWTGATSGQIKTDYCTNQGVGYLAMSNLLFPPVKSKVGLTYEFIHMQKKHTQRCFIKKQCAPSRHYANENPFIYDNIHRLSF